jgi:hypothetical protein
MTFTLDSHGYFNRHGHRIIPVGANYWPASCGVEMWQRWPATEMQHDLDLMSALGLNCIRFFLRWQDFEPRPGRYDARAFKRLADFLRWCRQRDILAHPSLFVGFMSGGIFWPEWRKGRNVFSDPYMTARAAAFAKKAAAVIAPYRDCVLAIDQGNELCCLPDSSQAPPAFIVNWCATVNRAIRASFPDCLIISGNEQNQVLNDTGWRFVQQPGCDLYSMHGYPVPAWHSVSFDGMTDPLCQTLLPLYTKIARAFGPVMLQEFGTIVTFGKCQQDNYLRAILPACWNAGANGFLWWCLRDITANVHPYTRNQFESTLGLVDHSGKIKPGLEFFLQFARQIQTATRAPQPSIGLYWPKEIYHRDNQANPGNEPRHYSRSLVMANYLLQQLGHEIQIVRGDQPLENIPGTLVIPGAVLRREETEAIIQWVRNGGRVIWHGVDSVNFGHAYIELLGARPVNYRSPQSSSVKFGGRVWSLPHHPRHVRIELSPVTAEVLTRDKDRLPVVLKNRLGKGVITYATPQIEETVATESGHPARRDQWTKWYRAMLSQCG